MARGWESKSVESQMEAAEARRPQSPTPKLTPEEIAKQREREGLESSRKRVLHDIEKATNPHYRELLQAALRHLDDKLAGL